MKKGYFITGTDTNVGKTSVTLALITYFKQQGASVIAMKPVASGCNYIDRQWKNGDALAMQADNSFTLAYSLINPYAYEKPISPHLAGIENPADFEKIYALFQAHQQIADIVLVEGAGGWYTPLNESQSVADLALKIQLPVILIVGIRLGCINHALLTLEAINKSSLSCAGWIAVCTDSDFNYADLTIQTLTTKLSTPLLGIFPFCETLRLNIMNL